MKRLATYATGLGLVVVAGLVHGQLSRPTKELEDAAKRVVNVPLRIGDWVGQELESDQKLFDQAGALGHIMRSYTNQRTGASVLVILMCGRPGKMSVHTPEVCYRGAGYELAGDPQPWRVAGGAELGTLWTAQFNKEAGRGLRLYWGWSADGSWEAPSSPRWRFWPESKLYKLYVSHEASDPGPSSAHGPMQDFMKQFLKEANRTLFDAHED